MISSTLQATDSVASHHWEEWQLSGVSAKIINLNLKTIYDSREIDKILNRNNKSRWKHSNNLIPAWAVSGIDPQTGEPTLLGVQVKPDTPVLNKQGKLQKYLSPSEYQLAPLFLDTGIEGFWQDIINDKSKPIIITEGAKKAGAGLSIGYITISVPGVSTCRKDGRLHDLLKLLTGFGRTFYLCFDNDIIVKKPVQNGMTGLSKELAATGSKVMVIELPPGECKGMDDFISEHGQEEFGKLVENAKTIEEWRKSLDEQWIKRQLEEDGEEQKCKLKRQFEIVRDGWGDGLRFNELKNQIELGGQPIDIEQIRLHLALEFNEVVPLGDAQAIIEMLARQNKYNPVTEYLDHLEQQYPDIDTSILDDLATRYFGSNEPLHNIYMKKTLIAAVARARNPGCKHDYATILVGKQGWFKSTFWKVLFSEDWFSDELGDANEKDELMKLHRFWGLEWSEFETVYKRKDVSSLKKFMTSTTDAFRAPYARNVKEYPRGCILFGTTNETEILNDPTGSRRFWIIHLLKKIPIKLLKAERDRLWAAANALYQAGKGSSHLHNLTDQESELQEQLNQPFQVKDPWEPLVGAYLKGREYVTTDQVLLHLGVETGRQDVALSRRVSSLLRRFEWKYTYKRFDSELLRVWVSEKNKKLGFLEGSEGSEGSVTKSLQFQHSITDGSLVTNYEPNPQILTTCPNEQEILSTQKDHPLAQTQQSIQAEEIGGDPSDPSGNQNFLFFNNSVTSEPDNDDLIQFQKTPTFEVGDTIRITSHPTRLDAVGSVEKIASVNGFVKTESGIQLCKGEFEKITPQEVTPPAPQPLATENAPLPLIQEKAIYWSQSQKREVKVFRIFDDLSEVSCQIPEKGTFSLPFTDLLCCQQSPRHNLKVGDEVVILVGKHSETFATVTTMRADGIFLKSDGKSLKKVYFPHQLVKV